jgi:hypothetical protein
MLNGVFHVEWSHAACRMPVSVDVVYALAALSDLILGFHLSPLN